jgi:hypothetical protein
MLFLSLIKHYAMKVYKRCGGIGDEVVVAYFKALS